MPCYSGNQWPTNLCHILNPVKDEADLNNTQTFSSYITENKSLFSCEVISINNIQKSFNHY